MKYLIVNADDYGHSPGVSRGIRYAHAQGIVTGTTAMMNMPHVAEDLRLAQAECPGLGLGVHLTLTTGAPLLPPRRVPSLVNGADRFLELDAFRKQAAQINPADLYAEWSAQIKLFCDIVGRAPDHLDSHHHTSYYNPILFATMLDLAVEYRCAVRSPLVDDVRRPVPGTTDPKWRDSLKRILTNRLVSHPHHFITDFYDEGATRETLSQLLAALADGFTEIMCHPGYVDEALRMGSRYTGQRERELDILTNPALKSQIADRKSVV
jgi:predicted glycoside hydrolase/deacetylase ChbG (UPF0249 family)